MAGKWLAQTPGRVSEGWGSSPAAAVGSQYKFFYIYLYVFIYLFIDVYIYIHTHTLNIFVLNDPSILIFGGKTNTF